MLSYLKQIALAGLLIAASAAGVYALNQDQTRNFPVRLAATQQTHYWRVLVNYNDSNISTAQKFGAIGQNAFIDNVECEVVTAFNAGTTNTFTLGTSTSANEIVSSSDLTGNGSASLSTQVSRVTRGFGRSLTASADTTLYAKYTQTGTAATTGQIICVIAYVPNNDL